MIQQTIQAFFYRISLNIRPSRKTERKQNHVSLLYVYDLVFEGKWWWRMVILGILAKKPASVSRWLIRVKMEPMMGVEPITYSLYLNKNLYVSRKNKKLLWYNSIVWLIKLEMPQRAVNLLLGYR